jgi:two-component system, NarL family, sensor histidine kinase DegS
VSATAKKGAKLMPTDGIQQSDVAQLRQQVDGAISDIVKRLREIESMAEQRLRQATTERQHLEAFLDELQYRLSSLNTTGSLPTTVTGPLTESQVLAMQGQQDSLVQHRAELDMLRDELDPLTKRLAWMVHQIEGAGEWVLSEPESDQDNQQHKDTQPNAGEQVMWAQIALGQEAERARLAREIHDGPAQALANTVMRLQFVEQMVGQRPQEVQIELAKLRAAIQASLKDVRRFIFNLRPASLSDAGLISTLKYYTSDFSDQFGIPVETNLPENLTLSADQELVVFRVIQEALQNIQKHAGAESVVVNVQQRPNGPLIVTIADDGKGFDPKMARLGRTGSSGLVNMRERAATVGGTLKMESRPGGGTTITLTMPMPKN